MKHSAFHSLLTTTVTLIVFAFSAVMTVPAYADDSVPPPSDPTTEGAPPVDGSTPTAVSPDFSPAVVEGVPAGLAPVEDTSADFLAQIPSDTQVVVVDTQGDVLPLASEAAAQAVANGDPIWCPLGVAPIANTGSCSISYTFLGDDTSGGLVDNIPGYSLPGVIWVEWDYDGTLEPSSVINLNGAFVAPGSDFALTIQGGWNGTPGSTALNAAQPYSIFTVPLWIQNWNGAVTLKNIVVDDSSAPVALLSSDSALKVTTAGNITLDTVKVQNNSDTVYTLDGAYLDNTSSSTGASVTIRNSSFDQNEGYGLDVHSYGVVTTTNLGANGNGGYGARISNYTAGTDKAVTMTGFQQFNYNGGWGLGIVSRGLITLANIVADNNTGSSGVTLTNTYSTGNLGVTIKGVNQFNNNGISGLLVFSHGVITLNSITANYNGKSGAELDNATLAPLPKAVTLAGTNNFNGNGIAAAGFGLKVISRGAITLNNVTASGNNTGGNDVGVYLENMYFGGGVTIKGYGTFEHNADYGLQIFSTGAILLNNINANNNGFGAILDNCIGGFEPGGYEFDCYPAAKPLTLKGTNNFNGNTSYGLEALSGGALIAANLTANGNGSAPSWYQTVLFDGNATSVGNAFLDSELGITLTGTNTFDNNTAYEGVTIYSDGKVTVSNLNANGNFGRGAYVSGTGTTTLTGVNTFNNNGGGGLRINNNYGTITLNNVTANGNGSSGAYIQNDYVTATPWNITLLGTNQFNENSTSGLEVESYGTVLLNNITANDTSAGYGMLVHNEFGTLPKAITLKGFNNFNNNNAAGMELYSQGVITLNNITADNNGERGTYIQNNYLPASAGSPGVFIKGTNSFSYNLGVDDGLEIVSKGAITLNNVSASNNLAYGAYLNNFGGLLKAVTITGVNNFSGNAYTGLTINASGVVTLTRVTANNNDPTNSASGSGIYVTAAGNITLTCGFAYNNGLNGIYLHSSGGLVTVKGAYSFSNNIQYDLSVPNVVIYPCALP